MSESGPVLYVSALLAMLFLALGAHLLPNSSSPGFGQMTVHFDSEQAPSELLDVSAATVQDISVFKD